MLGLPEWKWVDQVLEVLGREDAETMHDLVYEMYRGDENISKRQWSGLCSHLESQKNSGGELRNCPLVATLKLFFRSLKSANKSAGIHTKDVSDDDFSGNSA